MSKDLPATALAVFGVSGDLSRRYLLPALAQICQSSEVSAKLNVLGISRREIKPKDVLPAASAGLAGRFQSWRMDYEQASEYQRLAAELGELGGQQVIFYFAVPPEAVLPIIRRLGEAGLNTSQYRLLMEKPFGSDLGSAETLIKEIDKYFKEEQVYRIDHYLAKEAAQNIAVFLGSNALFRDVWSNQFIERIEIVAEESIGIEGRGHFYEQTGALRDMVQSHLLQLAALTLMEPCPDVFDFSNVRSRRLTALRHLTAKADSIIKAQYQGYRQEVGNQASSTETFVALELESSQLKWQGVPIQLVTGKRLDKRLTEIRVFFKKTQSAQTNLLKLRVQPREAIELELWVKKPGYEQDLQKLPLDFSYQQHFQRLPDAYERVIVDAVRGQANLFAGSEEVLASWRILEPLLSRWEEYPLAGYKPGSSAEAVLQNT